MALSGILGDDSHNKDSENTKNRAMLDFGLQGKAELSQMVIAVTVGIFAILTLFTTNPSVPEWVALTIAYWGLFLLGIWVYSNHQMYASITDIYLKKINPNFENDLRTAVQQNVMARWMHNRFWMDKPYPIQAQRIALSVAAYVIILVFLYITFALRVVQIWPLFPHP